MKTVIISKKTLLLIILSIVGLTMLFLGLWNYFGEKTDVPSLQVSSPAAGEVRFNNNGTVVLEKKPGDFTVKPAAKENSNFFVEYRLERERVRGQRVEWLREVMNNADSSAETRQKAQEKLMSISNNMEKEIEMENLIKANGYNDAAVVVDDRSVTVIVATANLTAEEAARLTSLVSRGTGVDGSNIVIIPRS